MNQEAFLRGMVDEMEKSAYAAKALQTIKRVNPNIAAGVGGGAVGGLSSRRKRGESSQDYAKRTALMAGGGALAGVAGRAGIAKGMKHFKDKAAVKARGANVDRAKGVATMLGVGVPAIFGGKSNVGKAAKGLENLSKAKPVETLARGGEGAKDKAFQELAEGVSKQREGIGTMFKGWQGRRKFNKQIDTFKTRIQKDTGTAATTKQINAEKSRLKAGMSFDPEKGGVLSDTSKIVGGKNVQRHLTDTQMAVNRAIEDLPGVSITRKGDKPTKISFGKTQGSGHWLGRGKDVSFAGGVGAAEKKLNTAIRNLKANPNLTSEQRTTAVNQLLDGFKSQHGNFDVIRGATRSQLQAGGRGATLKDPRTWLGRAATTTPLMRAFGGGNEYNIVAKSGKNLVKVSHSNNARSIIIQMLQD